MFALSLSSFSLFGMTGVFLCTPQLKTTWAAVVLFFAAMSWITGCSKKVVERPGRLQFEPNRVINWGATYQEENTQ